MDLGLIEKIAVWTFFVTIVAVLVSLSYAVIHLVRGTATQAKMDEGFVRIASLLTDIKQEVKQDMIDHLSTAHVNKP